MSASPCIPASYNSTNSEYACSASWSRHLRVLITPATRDSGLRIPKLYNRVHPSTQCHNLWLRTHIVTTRYEAVSQCSLLLLTLRSKTKSQRQLGFNSYKPATIQRLNNILPTAQASPGEVELHILTASQSRHLESSLQKTPLPGLSWNWVSLVFFQPTVSSLFVLLYYYLYNPILSLKAYFEIEL